jgi:hypothetical protein
VTTSWSAGGGSSSWRGLVRDEGEPRGVELGDADLEAYFRAHEEEFTKPEEVRVSELRVRDRGRAEQASREGMQAAAAGSDPLEIAKRLVGKYSEDGDAALRHGDLGFFARKTAPWPPAIVETAFALGAPGSTSAPIPVDGAYRVLVLTGRRPAVRHTVGELKGQIRQRLVAERQKARLRQLTDRLEREARIETLLPRGP